MLEETLLHLPFSSQRPGYTALGQNRHSCCCLAGISRICLLWGSKCTSGLTVHLLFNSWLLVSSLKGSDVSSPQDNGFSPGRPEFPSALTRLQGSGLQANVWVSRPLHSPAASPFALGPPPRPSTTGRWSLREDIGTTQAAPSPW